ncbi:MAG: DNA-processing protein DprA [Xanthomonadales bacterium]|nr:DNA-processing protein DprA [Xanthomonadales bacterium]
MATAGAAVVDSLDAWLRLLRAPGLGGQALRRLLQRFGDAPAVLAEIRAHGTALDIAARTRAWLAAPDHERLAADRIWLDQPGHRLLPCTDPDYPALLADSPWAPVALFVRGDAGLLWQPQIAIVGSRNPTAGGRDSAHAFAAALARGGLTVTSGLASGIDAAAHEGALSAVKRTIAVVGTGLDLVYPAANAALAERIAASGVIVSEHPPGTPAKAQHFPSRNRIIAGLSLGTLVVEAALRSGSLITARLAGEVGREVFALPGSIHNPMAKGCHRLIREGARLVETAQEIVEELRPMAQRLGDRLRQELAALPGDGDALGAGDGTGDDALAAGKSGDSIAGSYPDPDYQRLWSALGHDPVAIETMVQRTGLTTQAISSMLMIMELDGLVTAGRSGRYARAGGIKE